MKIAICDDHSFMCNEVERRLKDYIIEYHCELSIEFFYTGAALLLAASSFDIVFLDIELKRENGIEIAEQFGKISRGKIIFLTSHIEEMPNGYKVKAFRFLTKPINKKLFIEAVSSAIEEISSEKKIELYNDDKIVVVHRKDIVYAEAGNHASCVRTVEGVFRSPLILEELKGQLEGPDFICPHRSYIVNMAYITEIGTNEILMHDGEKVRISRLKHKEFKKLFYRYLRGKTNGHD